MIKAGVVGATGYTGEELVKILARHKGIKINSLTAIIDKPTVFSDLFPTYRGSVDIVTKGLDVDEVSSEVDLVFLALPHTVSMQYVPKFINAGKKVIDLSADYRLEAPVYAHWYKTEHMDTGNLASAVYGMPEFYRKKIKEAALIANPGCYPTGAILAAAPAVNWLTPHGLILVDAKSGATGAGRRASIALSFGEVDENFKAYKINAHQHAPEMVKLLSDKAGRDVKVTFVPHLIPARRGILSTVYIPMDDCFGLDENSILKRYKEFYKGEPFVRIYDEGKLPEIKNVVSTNYCDIGLKLAGKHLVIVSCIDNLLKGAAGQAVQNMNIMYGFDEEEGLI